MRYKKKTRGDGRFLPEQVAAAAKEGFQGWSTPQAMVDMVAKLLGIGHFELDVCALAHNAKAERYLTPDDDGLDTPWDCYSAWCNPPFKASEIDQWANRTVNQLTLGQVRSMAAFLTVPKSDQAWWHMLLASGLVRAQIDCRGRIAFLDQFGVPGTQQDSATTILVLSRSNLWGSMHPRRGWITHDKKAHKWRGGWFGEPNVYTVNCHKQLL